MFWIKPRLKKKNERSEKPLSEKYHWTLHSQAKMRHYRLSPGRIKRIIRHPQRIEEGVAPNTMAAMQPSDGKKYEEIWVMWQKKCKMQKSKCKITDFGTIRVISAWRYPGKSPTKNPIPREILDEVRSLIY
ncbi:MAG: hypothetical protein Q8M83_06490 [bacterium]|nr:hypothetical protein [bacterium]